MMAKIVNTLHTQDKTASSNQENLFLIAIGASAGGLAPLEDFLASVVDIPHVSYVIIQHLPKDHKSMMKELLSRKSKLPIEEIKHRKAIKAGKVYLMPAGKILSLTGSNFMLRNKSNDRMLGYPIDVFFQSMAQEFGEHAITIVLSGTGSDGSKGIREVKQEEGLVLVQHPKTAQFDGMPQNAIATGHVDMVLPVSKLFEAAQKYIESKRSKLPASSDRQLEKKYILKILKQLKDRKRVDFTKYKKDFVLRRIFRMIQMEQKENLSAYFDRFDKDEGLLDNLFQELLLGVTQFFRNPGACRTIKDEVLPKLFQKMENNSLRIWVAGCSTGEEAYTLGIMLTEFLELNDLEVQIKIFATDANEEAIKTANIGSYPESIARDIPPDYLSKYFRLENGFYTINRKIRELIVFTRHNLIEDVPFNNLDLISCRNVMIYFQPQVQYQVFAAFNFALKREGFLWLGTSETTKNFKEVFKPISKKQNIFISTFQSPRKKASRAPQFYNREKIVSHHIHQSANQITTKLRLLEASNEILIEEMDFSGLLVNEKMDLLRYFGHAHKFLKVPNEPGTWNLLKMINSEAAAILSAAIRRAKSENKRILFKEVSIYTPENLQICDITVVPYRHQGLEGKLFMILIKEKDQVPEESKDAKILLNDTFSERIHDLETELQLNRENLQSTIEELQTSNEELMTANEELQGTNEELQSVNEELYTINAEHQKTIEMISDLNNDLDNLLKHTHLGILFLDEHLRIRRFNSVLKEEIHVTDADVGRPIAHFSSLLNYKGLESDARDVLSKSNSIEKEITSQSGKWYMIRIMPYEIGEGVPSGIVCTLVDISKIKGVDHIKELNIKNREQELQIKDLEKEVKRLNEANKRSGDSLKTFVNLQDAAVLEFNKKGNIINQVLSEDYSGLAQEVLSREEILPLASILPEESRKILSQKLNDIDILDAGEIESMVVENGEKENRLYQEIRITQTNNHNLLAGIFNKSREVNLEHELKEMLGLGRLISQNLPDVFIATFNQELICNFAEGNFLLALKEGESFTKFEKEYPQLLHACRSALKGKTKELEIQREQDAFILHVLPFENESEEIQAGLLLAQRITDMKKVQYDLQARLRDMEQFAYSVSHDLKSPLRSIISFAQLLQRNYAEKFDETAQEYFDFIISNTKSMSQLIQGLLNYARLGSQEHEPERLPINSLLDELINKFRNPSQGEKIEITYGNLPEVLGIYTHMIQLFQNLIENALKFNESDVKKVKISAQKNENWVQFSVKDNGIGIAPEYQEQIFEIFKHLNTRDKYEGSGIGLSQCKRIVERMNGRIWVRSEKNEGSEFFFTLPAAI